MTRSLPNSTQTLTPIFTSTATHTLTPTPSASVTRKPYTYLVSTAFYITKTPTLSLAQANALVLDLLETNAGCQLPCWWGIVPGETKWPVARAFLAQVAVGIFQGDLKYYVEQEVRYPITYFGVSYNVNGKSAGALFYLKNNIINSIKTGPSGTDINYRLHQFLSRYGRPDQVLLSIAHVPIEPLPVNLVLVYEEGFLAYYELEVSKLDDQGYFWICPTTTGPELWMWDSANEPSTNDVREFVFGADPPRHRQLQPIEKATNLTIDAFYEQFKELKPNNCLQTSESIWP